MAGLPYNCRCFTVTGNVAGIPNPSATGNGGGGGGGGSGGIVPGVRGACSPSGPVISLYPPSDIVAQGFGAGVSPSALIGNGTYIVLTGSPFTISSSGCYTLYMQSGGGGGGGAGAYFSWCDSSRQGYAPGGPGGIGGVGVFSMISLQLLAGDILTYSTGQGGSGGRSGTPNGAGPPNGDSGSAGTSTTATITRNGQTVYYFFAPGGAGGQGGNAAGGSVPSNGFQGSLIPGPPGNSGNGGVGIAQQLPIAGTAGFCSIDGNTCIYTFSVTGPSGAANWFGNPGRGFYGIWNCQNTGTTVMPFIPPFGYGYGGSGAADGASNIVSTNGGGGFLLLVKYS